MEESRVCGSNSSPLVDVQILAVQSLQGQGAVPRTQQEKARKGPRYGLSKIMRARGTEDGCALQHAENTRELVRGLGQTDRKERERKAVTTLFDPTRQQPTYLQPNLE